MQMITFHLEGQICENLKILEFHSDRWIVSCYFWFSKELQSKQIVHQTWIPVWNLCGPGELLTKLLQTQAEIRIHIQHASKVQSLQALLKLTCFISTRCQCGSFPLSPNMVIVNTVNFFWMMIAPFSLGIHLYFVISNDTLIFNTNWHSEKDWQPHEFHQVGMAGIGHPMLFAHWTVFWGLEATADHNDPFLWD